MTDYDVIVIGAGAAGGIVACVLAEAGKSVLLLERGREIPFDSSTVDHLRNQRLSQYGHNAGPDVEDHPRVIESRDGRALVVRPHEGGYHNNAGCVGGGTRVYGGMAWRFMPQDFRMASLYGVPEGSSLVDWPITYDDLEPWYDRAEWEIGVGGDGSGNVCQGPRRRGYPMPSVAMTLEGVALRRGAEKLGLSTFTPPFLINTVPYNNRPACIQCAMCVGMPCPSDGKNGTQNTVIPRALATGRCQLLTVAMVEKIETDSAGRATGVSYIRDDKRCTARAKTVVCSAGAIESARLLLNSATDRHPRGLGNDHDQVGRNLQGHYYPAAIAILPEDVYDGIGPGVSIATCQFNHGNPGGIVGGGMLANDFTRLPVIHAKRCWPGDVPRWGLKAKRFMRDNYRRTVDIKGPVHEIPSADGRVTIDANVRDRWGIPVARLSGTTHPETVRTAEYLRQRAIDWLNASGATKVWSNATTLHLSAGQHQAGTCRMGTDPKKSVTDSFGRVHGHDNLFVIDGSLHPTNGGFNPVLTIMALAFRNAEHVARSL